MKKKTPPSARTPIPAQSLPGSYVTLEETVTNTRETTTIEDSGFYLLMDDITGYSCKEAIRFILKENLKTKNKHNKLTLIISSYGGRLDSCFALIDTMKGSPIPIHTVGLGSIGSCGLLIFMSGAKGHRVITPNTSILSHQWAWGSYGKEHELFARQKEFNLISDRIVAHYKKCTGLSEKIIKQILLPAQDVWLSADEALKYKLCDSIKEVY